MKRRDLFLTDTEIGLQIFLILISIFCIVVLFLEFRKEWKEDRDKLFISLCTIGIIISVVLVVVSIYHLLSYSI